MKKTLLVHVDIDSTRTLLRFWGHDDRKADLDHFYGLAMQRSLALFERLGIPVTYFCVGEELEISGRARATVLEAHQRGHEIANHTHTHPYALTEMTASDREAEIDRCSAAIRSITGQNPVGFRAPSYDVNNAVFETLRSRGFAYDSSAAWSSILPLIKFYHSFFTKKKTTREFGAGSPRIPRRPYRPHPEDWMRPGGSAEGLLELPVTRSEWLNLPFYNNFHLITGAPYRNVSVALLNQPVVVYLVHLIEFVDLSDGLPRELAVHPNVKTPSSAKTAFLEKTLRQLLARYECRRTDAYAASGKGLHETAQ